MPSDDMVTPFDVEREMVELGAHIDAAPKVVKDYHTRLREARKTYKRAYNLAYAMADGPATSRRVEAERACEAEQDALDVAEIEFRYVSDLLDAYKTKLRALQSISSLMKAQMFTTNG